MIGSTLSHYRILGEIGAGGMGTVYHAFDTDLGRPVAIKCLRPEFALQPDRKERFLREARAAAALTHPNICTIHEVGRAGDELFIVMQFIEGRTLGEEIACGPLDAERFTRIAIQLAEALAEAHGRGVVHRDLKPSNVMIDGDGRVKVLDFGLATILGRETALPDATTAAKRPLTGPGQAIGTPGYMSPEQIRGEQAGAAADIFSLGVTLYEVATGQHPFLRGNHLQTIAAVLGEYPPPVRARKSDFPARLDEIILKCLAKRTELRYQDGAAVLSALRDSDSGAGRASSVRIAPRSIAVLPFANLQGNPEDDYLSDGLTTEIITTLAKLKGVLVISRSTTLRFRDAPLDAQQIGRELSVQTVLEGGIARQGSRCRVTVQLLDVADGFCLWADKYDFALDDLFHIQTSVSSRIARALRPKLSNAAAPAQTPRTTADVDAFKLYLQGKSLYYHFNSTDNLLAIEAFRRALKIDAGYAQAHAALASACMARLEREWEADEQRWTREALDAAERAIACDPWLSEPYSARAVVLLRQQRVAEAEAELRRALAINANDDIAHSMLGRILFERGDFQLAARAYRRALKISPDYVWCWNDLAWVQWLLGRFADTERALTRVLGINPLDEIARVGVATGHYFRGELDAAVAAARKSIEINPHHPFPRPVLAVALARQGHIAEAKAICREALEARPGDFLAGAALGLVHAIAGDAEELQRANERALSITAGRAPLNLNVAVHYAFLNFPHYARLWLEKAFREGVKNRTVLRHNPFLQQFASEFLAAENLRRRKPHAGEPGRIPDADQDRPDHEGESKTGRLDPGDR